MKLSQPGTYFRSIGFVDDQHGFAGNISTNYFPGVTDATPLYETFDGGDSWTAVKDFPLPTGAGVCAIDIVQDSFVNAGVLSHRAIVSVAGRVGGPAYLVRSVDGGAHWQLIDLGPHAAMVLDVKFFDANTGYVAGATDREIERSRALVLRTTDGGQTWQRVYESKRPFEMAWKESFPSRDVGYVTIMNYNEDPAVTARVVAKTTNGGLTWRELPLDSDHSQQEFGVAFASAKIGWVGAVKGGYETVDGGKKWKRIDLGRLVNKIRIVPTSDGFVGYAIGSAVFKLDARPGAKSNPTVAPPGEPAEVSLTRP